MAEVLSEFEFHPERMGKAGYYSRLSPEQLQRRKETNERARQAKLARETPEQANARRARDAVYAKSRYTKIDRNERNSYLRKSYKDYRIEVIDKLGSRCNRCGIMDTRVLHIDHINGGGRLHRKSRNSVQVLIDILDNPDQYQLLCANCHMIKTQER